MVWAAFASDRSKSPLIFIDVSVKVNSEVYVEMLDEKVLPWVTETFRTVTSSLKTALAHSSNLTQKWCKKCFSGFWDETI
uniref:Uncharacterized protein n=1 Tax=Octopus bimaculoides TaxID=37653 RepID=A0A0L8H9K4_OCTBM